MKAKKEKPDETTEIQELKETKSTSKVLSLLKLEEIQQKFPQYSEQIGKYQVYSEGLSIIDQDGLMVAENTSSEILEISKNVEKVRKTFKDPYLLAGKTIDTYAKTILDPLDKARERINVEITKFKTIQAAQASKEAEERKKELEKLEVEKIEENNKINRIETQLNAKLYGGFWFSKDGLRKTSAGCIETKDCIALLEIIEKEVPRPDTFIHFKDRYVDMLDQLKIRIADKTKALIELDNADREKRNSIITNLAEQKTDAELGAVDNKEKGEKLIVKETKKEEKVLEKTVSDAHKGIRTRIDFTVQDTEKIPRIYMQVDIAKIREYIDDHNEIVRKAIESGNDLIPGIRFFIDSNYVTG